MLLEEKINRWKVSQIKKIGPLTFLKIIEKFGSATVFLNSDSKYRGVLNKTCNIDPNSFFVLGEGDYPALLSHISDPPIVVYYKGNKELLSHPKLISIVGTRKVSEYGKSITAKLTEALVKSGFVTVSGLASGVDSIVHKQTLKFGGDTVAVLGGPVNNIYPRSNTNLYNEILSKNGVIISEVMVGERIQTWQFPRRNRIVAGLSSKTIVTEAPNRSGALITANLAFDFNREVYAIPAHINISNNVGCNKLIASNKAQLLYDFSVLTGVSKKNMFDISCKIGDCSTEEKRILSLIQTGKNKIDLISTETGKSVTEISNLLLNLEIKSLIAKNLIGQYEFLN